MIIKQVKKIDILGQIYPKIIDFSKPKRHSYHVKRNPIPRAEARNRAHNQTLATKTAKSTAASASKVKQL